MLSRRTRKELREAREWRELRRSIKSTLIAAACGLWTLAPSAMAAPGANELPTGESYASDAGVTINRDMTNAVMDINQSTDRAVINWSTFNVGENATVNFNHYKVVDGENVANTAAMTLNRVTGNNMSEIYGKINSVGSVILVNPHGIMFDGNAEVNAAGIVASTADIADADFLNDGKLVFAQTKNNNNANITLNKGTLTADIDGGYINSMASSTLNLGTRRLVTDISAVGNKIMLVADGNITVGAEGKLMATTVTNTAATTSSTTTNGITITKDVAGATAEGTIILRADQNADDVNATGTAATVTLNNTETSQIQGVNVKVYYNDEITAAGVNGTTTESIGIYGSNGVKDGKFTMKNYASGHGAELEGKIADTVDVRTREYNESGDYDCTTTNYGVTVNKEAYSLINDIYQLQAIDGQDTATYTKYNYALGGDIKAADTANWTDSSGNTVIGFDPIGKGSSDKTGLNYNGNLYFEGDFTGNGGTGSYAVYDLNISRGAVTYKNYIGLFAAIKGSNISDLSIIDPVINGNYDIGGLAGYANESTIENVTVRKRVFELDGEYTKTANKANIAAAYNTKVSPRNGNIGGIVGTTRNTTLKNCVNGSQVEGEQYVGGLIGSATNYDGYTGNVLENCVNKGYYSADNGENGAVEDVTQGYGVVTGTNFVGGLVGVMGGYANTNNIITDSYSNGQVSGTNAVGGLLGLIGLGKGNITNSYNSNEAEPGLATIVDSSKAKQSVYGQVVASGDVAGGILGSATTNAYLTIKGVYNAGNITANKYAGGILGHGGTSTVTITDSYNADNNTVLVDSDNYAGFTCVADDGTTHTYAYNSTAKKWYDTKDSATLYTDKQLESIAKLENRRYNTRLAYRDATVTVKGAGGYAGGIAGYLNAKSSLNDTYSAGKIYDENANTTAGGLVGIAISGATASGTNFYITEQNVTGSISGDATKAVYSGTLANTEGKTLWQAENLESFGDSDKWYTYSCSTLPLLSYFMSGTATAGVTQYVYDGTAHLVDTSALKGTNGGTIGYYGDGAFSTYSATADNNYNFGRGINVANSESDLLKDSGVTVMNYGKNADGTVAKSTDSTAKSSFYSYKYSTLWSPQHGYKTVANTGIVVTPKAVTYKVNNVNKTYGETTLKAGDVIGGSYADDALAAGDKFDSTKLTESTYDADGNCTSVGTFSTDGRAKSATVTHGAYAITTNSADIMAAFGDNYDVTIVEGKLTVDPRAIGYKITATDSEKTYGTATEQGNFSFSFTDSLAQTELASQVAGIKFTATTDADGDNGLSSKADVGTYTITPTIASLKQVLGDNFVLTADATAITNATLKVNARAIGYEITDSTKTYGDTKDNKDFTLKFTDALAESELGGNKGRLTYTATGTTGADGLDSAAEVGDYNIAVTADTLKALLGKNYTISTATDAVKNGKLTVTPLTVYYNPDSATYTIGGEVPQITGSVVKYDGTAIKLTGEDEKALTFIVLDAMGNPVTDISKLTAGSYKIIGSGLTGTAKNYMLDGSAAQWYLSDGKLLVRERGIADDVRPWYEAAKEPMSMLLPERTDGTTRGISPGTSDMFLRTRNAAVGGVIPVEGRSQVRFLTIVDSGINIGDAPDAINHVTIAPSSYAAGVASTNGKVTSEDQEQA